MMGDGAQVQEAEAVGHMPQQDGVCSGEPQRLRMLDVSLVSRVRQRIPAPELAHDGLLQLFVVVPWKCPSV